MEHDPDLLQLLQLLAAALATLVAFLARQQRSGDRERLDRLSERLNDLGERHAVSDAKLERAQRDIANDKQGREAFGAAITRIDYIADRMEQIGETVTGISARIDRQSDALTDAHRRIDHALGGTVPPSPAPRRRQRAVATD